jgi:dienelactone hydrolase
MPNSNFPCLKKKWPVLLFLFILAGTNPAQPLPGTAPLTLEGDIASHLVEGVDRFLLRKLNESTGDRARHWTRDFSSPEAYSHSLEPNRQRLAHILGARDARIPFESPELMATLNHPGPMARGKNFLVHQVRWPAFGGVHGEGLLLLPDEGPIIADVIAIPDADLSPEQITGLAEGIAPDSQYARRLAESGCRVLVPLLIDRSVEPRNGRAQLTSREFLYRPAFELGRHLIGYEAQKVLAAVDWFAREERLSPSGARRNIHLIGWGEGGLIALYAAALDPRIDAACVSGYFDDRLDIWREPIDRNLFGLLEQFGDAELAGMIAPRRLIIEAAGGPELELPGHGGAPGRLRTPEPGRVKNEFERARQWIAPLRHPASLELIASGNGAGPFGTEPALEKLIQAPIAPLGPAPEILRPLPDAKARMARQMGEIDRHNQSLLHESPYVRQEFMKKLDTSSLEKFQTSSEPYRQFFYEEIIGRFPDELLDPNPSSRIFLESEKWTAYEVVLEVFPEVIAYGLLLLPLDLAPGEKRPVVVCQHGLEGRPQDTIGEDGYAFYKAFAAKLAERGFITFAPQNLYIFNDRFRSLQRKANPLKKTLFSIITPQHQQIVNWLQTLPNVDPERIAFYGLSYGGKTAMRVPPLVEEYCLSICSADFNEWVWKNASTRSPYSYVWTGEYEIFEFDLGSTFNYAEMAALIAPRPFMVERGHFDGVAPDEAVAYEFAKVRFLYQGKLGIAGRLEIEWFPGPHTINAEGTFNFLHKHLNFPKKE